ncbi:MAG: ABC transporter ATP-binding protein [Actinobacteria bacterium]|nr:MAG: ABC transporter ATP-binding protein [Actinomycetota bacterium]
MIRLTNATKVYETRATETVALDGVSFNVDAGEFLAIMGPSGSGKSTLMNILGCLDTLTAGSYLLDGVDVSSLSDDDLADVRVYRIGFVFQSFNLLPRVTVLRNVMLPMAYAGVPVREREERAYAALEAVGLEEDRYDHKSNELSGGQMQRVAIARALVNDPAIILADEPTGNLDTKTGELILETFERLKSEGRTILLITHEASVAEHADRVVHIRDGQIVDGREVGHELP